MRPGDRGEQIPDRAVIGDVADVMLVVGVGDVSLAATHPNHLSALAKEVVRQQPAESSASSCHDNNSISISGGVRCHERAWMSSTM